DMVCFIHRPEYYTKASEDANGNDIRGLAEFIIAKHRNGAVGDVKMRFIGKFTRFENWEEGYRMARQALESASTIELESRMNKELDAKISESPFSSPLPDIMPGPGDDNTPF
ncbi:MAG: DnaB-like helicase C-terminal domain-containing protein, partial [Muribaculaceae bacterium]|nr:DnaB-like helicase C-terminal domain-containing protein [Muribaculaceae bacterium]